MGYCFAMMIVVLRMGPRGHDERWKRFKDSGTPCKITLAVPDFSRVPKRCCGLGTASQLHMPRIVMGILEVVPASSSNIKKVKKVKGELSQSA